MVAKKSFMLTDFAMSCAIRIRRGNSILIGTILKRLAAWPPASCDGSMMSSTRFERDAQSRSSTSVDDGAELLQALEVALGQLELVARLHSLHSA
jgi:hypothetical protein